MKRIDTQKNIMAFLVAMSRAAGLLLVLSVTAVIAGCNGFLSLQTTGAIEVSVVQSMENSKTLLPPLNMTVSDYVLTGTGPAGSSLGPTTISAANPSASLSGLPIGAWTFNVIARNAASVAIGEGSKDATVVPGASTSVAITVVPRSGTGDLSINLSWPPASIPNPAITASITPVGSTTNTSPNTITIDQSLGTASLVWSGVQTGYYTMTILVKNGTTDKAGVAETVRILKDQTTSGTYTWTKVN